MPKTTPIEYLENANGKKYTEKQKKFLSLFHKNNFQNPKECAIEAGYSAASAFHAVRALKTEVQQLAESVLIMHAPRAALSLTNMLSSDEPIPQATVKIQAAKEILDRSGVVKPEKLQVETNISGSLFILPAKEPLDGIAERVD